MTARAYILAGVPFDSIAAEGESLSDAGMEGVSAPPTPTPPNAGDQPLEIHPVPAPGGCTATALAKRTLFPYHIPAGDVNFLLYRGIGLQRPEVFAGGHRMDAADGPGRRPGREDPVSSGERPDRRL